ncbi:5-oxoprolinase subunit PxpB [Paenibacillus sinopodophylli]|uniref:5-oxoprolinase subunit PxpB n=1 Tax=Paenibacillus sinopodophylli TaxID=1837342 RepID=UPI001FEBE23A|nr:5-oxoprolinase subunit PxpB [Paenibacillus sinopodophylli]
MSVGNRMKVEAYEFELLPLGNSAVIVRLGSGINLATHESVQALIAAVELDPFIGFVECVPSYAAVAVHYDPMLVMRSRSREELGHETIYETVCVRLHLHVEKGQKGSAKLRSRTVEIPVCYGGDFGPDLAFVAEYNGLAEDEVTAIHADAPYLVYMLGFAPGFPYLGGMSERIAAPRRQSPRASIPQGSVGIAGKQTGVYSVSTPGGWQLIGRTPIVLFRPQEMIPSLLRPGDTVRFKPITIEEYDDYIVGER